MKLTTKATLKVGFEGNRSPSYVGVNLFLSASYFNKTRDGVFSMSRPDPRVRHFNINEQSRYREELMQAGVNFDIPKDQIEIEWKSLIRQATEIATEAHQWGCGRTPETAIPFTKENQKILFSCYLKARRFLMGEIKDRCEGEAYWHVFPSQEFKFSTTKDKRSIPLRVRHNVLQRDGGLCCICGRKPPEVVLHVDHVHPHSKGGKTCESNLRILCHECNLGKGDQV